MKKFRLLRVLLLSLSLGAAAQAQTINFDDLPVTNDGLVVPGGYNGLTWNNFYYLTGTTYAGGFSGYHTGAVSTPNVALNWFANPASFSSATNFNLVSLSLAAAWNDGLNVRIQGQRGGSTIFDSTFIVNTTSPSLLVLGWANLDTVLFSSSGGTLHDFVSGGGGTHFAMDNLTISAAGAVPEPSTYGIAGIVMLAGVVAVRRKKRLLVSVN